MNQRTRSNMLLMAAGAGVFWAVRAAVRKRRELDFRGKTVLVTGGSRGLGLIMARQLADQGAHVAICARDGDELERARRDLAQRGGRVLAVPCDVTDRRQVDDLVHRVEGELGPIDVLINNAGVIEVAPLEHMTLEDFEEAMEVNFWGPVYTTLAVVPGMRARHSGRIVTIASIGGKISVPHLLPYSASKFAVTGFSEGLRAELAHDGILVTTVCPHLMRTGSPPGATFKGQNRAEYAWFSLSDSLPLVSMNAERAARRILTACKRGEAEVILTLQAKIAVAVHGLFPGMTADVLGWVNRLLLPEPGGIGSARALGKKSYSPVSPSVLTTLGDRASRRNNENP